MNKKRVIWLASWYPNRNEPFNGDFVQRHAQAAALYNEIYCIHVTRDNKTKEIEHSITKHGNLTEHIVYYPPSISVFSKLWNARKWIGLYKAIIEDYIKQNGKPDLIHVHVALNAGIIARWAKRKFGIPYVVTEHSSIYLDEARKDMIPETSARQVIKKRVLEDANAVTTVSSYLGNAVQKTFRNVKPVIIPNVVNTSIFHPGNVQKNDVTRFVHISTLDRNKHAELIINAFAEIAEPFRLDIYGPLNTELERLVKESKLETKIHFHKERPQSELALSIRDADALILFSEYETFSCVAIEAQACGMPVVGSDIPALRELISEGENGILVPSKNTKELAAKLSWLIANRNHFNRQQVAADAAARFSYERVGKEFDELYESLI